MAEGSGEKLCSLQFNGVHIPVIGLDLYIIGSGYNAALSGNGEAPLAAGLLSAGFHDAGIDEHDGILSGHVDDHDALEHAHLRSRKTHTVGLVHGLKHVVDEFPGAGRHLLYFLADLLQNGISDCSDISDCHGLFLRCIFICISKTGSSGQNRTVPSSLSRLCLPVPSDFFPSDP